MPTLTRMEGPLDLEGCEIEAKPVPFSRWILEQVDRGGFFGQLATIAKADRDFPRKAAPIRCASGWPISVPILRCSTRSTMPSWTGQRYDRADVG